MDTRSAIELLKQGGWWVAYHKGQRGREVVANFGTPILPTSFRDTYPAGDVQTIIQGLNPKIQVTIREVS